MHREHIFFPYLHYIHDYPSRYHAEAGHQEGQQDLEPDEPQALWQEAVGWAGQFAWETPQLLPLETQLQGQMGHHHGRSLLTHLCLESAGREGWLLPNFVFNQSGWSDEDVMIRFDWGNTPEKKMSCLHWAPGFFKKSHGMSFFAKMRFSLSLENKDCDEGIRKLVLPFTCHFCPGRTTTQRTFGNGGPGGGSCFHPLEWSTHTC